jgi:hypothetical protein
MASIAGFALRTARIACVIGLATTTQTSGKRACPSQIPDPEQKILRSQHARTFGQRIFFYNHDKIRRVNFIAILDQFSRYWVISTADPPG